MSREHLSDEDIEKFVTFEGPLKSEEGEKWIKFSQEVNGHIANCKDCRARVREAQELYDSLGIISEELGIPREEGIAVFDEISKTFDGAERRIEREEHRAAINGKTREIVEHIEKKTGLKLEDMQFGMLHHDDGHVVLGHQRPFLSQEQLEAVRRGEKKGKETKTVEGAPKTEGEQLGEKPKQGDLPTQIARADEGAKLKETELMPLKEKGFMGWIKGILDKLMGKGEK